jgi:NAD(P)H dehydrogenase (quinone)
MILVTGATGSIGRHLVRRLRDVPFTALARDEAKGRELGCPYVVGDFDDPDSVTAALTGIDQLVLNAGGAVPADGEQPMVRQQVTAIDAAVKAGVSRIVKVSVWGAKEGGRLAEGAHWTIERHLAASGVDWAVLQPSGFMQNFLTGAAVFTDEDRNIVGAYGTSRVSYIDCADIAACAQALLTGTRRGTFVLTGPESLNHMEIAAKLSTVANRRIRYIDLAPAELASTLVARGAPPRFADDVATLFAEVADGALETTTTTVAELTGHRPRTFDEFLADHHETVHHSWA